MWRTPNSEFLKPWNENGLGLHVTLPCLMCGRDFVLALEVRNDVEK